jgi:uncharacterized protein (TIGR00251 family)
MTEEEKGTTIKVKVVPNSKKFSVGEKNPWDGAWKIKVAAKAQDGKANKELIEELEKILNAKAKILAGEKSQKKTVFIEGNLEMLRHFEASQSQKLCKEGFKKSSKR